jgi:hypothetical protein
VSNSARTSAQALLSGMEFAAAPDQLADRPQDLARALGQPDHLLEPPACDIRQREQAQRFGSGRSIDHQHVELAALHVLVDPSRCAPSSSPGRMVTSSATMPRRPAG